MANGAGLETQNVAGAITNMRIDELVSNLAIGIASGQMELDRASMEMAQFLGEAQMAFGKRPGSDEDDLLSLIELGFTPNFYQFVDTILEVRVAISTQFEESREYDVSQRSARTNEYEAQSEYEAQRSASYSGSGSSYRVGGGWSRRGWGYGASSSQYGYSGAASSKYGSSSSYKAKILTATTVDAKYASTYNYAIEASSMIKTKLVPVPPPEVFEETIRAKVQQRREWEEMMRLAEQVRVILTGLTSSATSVRNNDSGLAAAVLDETTATDIQRDVLRLQDDYNQLTTNHWSVVTGSISDRAAADTAINEAIDKAKQLIDNYGLPEAERGVPETIETIRTAITDALNKFKEKIESVQSRVPTLPAGEE